MPRKNGHFRLQRHTPRGKELSISHGLGYEKGGEWGWWVKGGGGGGVELGLVLLVMTGASQCTNQVRLSVSFLRGH